MNKTNRRIWITAFIVVNTFLLAGCGTTKSGQEIANLDELDIAIREASNYLNVNIPARSIIVILNIQSDSTALSNYIIDELIANAVNDRNFIVVDRQQLESIRAEQSFQLSGEVDDNLALEIGRFFGAQTIVSGTIGQFANRYRMTVRALEVQTARVQGQFNRNLTAWETIVALMPDRGSGRTVSVQASNRTGEVENNAELVFMDVRRYFGNPRTNSWVQEVSKRFTDFCFYEKSFNEQEFEKVKNYWDSLPDDRTFFILRWGPDYFEEPFRDLRTCPKITYTSNYCFLGLIL